ncbi:MAG: chlorophyll synthesis pathway protein BchC [Pseudomonadota bacterium]|nr:chlorophyll synthesis pathway protein BchC [Pseudomonadota bacterium]
MNTSAVVLTGPKKLSVESLEIKTPDSDEVVVNINYSGISSGTERLFWSGQMPPFPGMGYPLVPGYESVGEIVEASKEADLKVGDFVFAPGANCFGEVKGLFGGASKTIVTRASRVIKIDPGFKQDGALFALAATARHAIAGFRSELPELIVGHGVLGRLLARMTIAAGGKPPTVWEVEKDRFGCSEGYQVIRPENDTRKDYLSVYDVSGDPNILDKLFGRLAKGGEIVLAGFYPENLNFAFPAAFIKEARFRVSAEFTSEDVSVTRELIEGGHLSLSGLITHQKSAQDVESAYNLAFKNPKCLKMILDWREVA